MPVAEIIAIGTELLLGEIQDTNTRFLARSLRDIGVDLYRTTCVGDNSKRISKTILESLDRCDIVITTGGLGPTVDDPTRQAVADALGVELEFHPELWTQIKKIMERYGRKASENNRRQAWIPAGAEVINNPVGTAPAFIAHHHERLVICLPGVPREMEQLLMDSVHPYLQKHFHLTSIIKSRILHVAGLGESRVDEMIGDLELQSNPTVGLLASPGRVDIRIVVKSDDRSEIDRLLAQTETVIRKKLGDAIYGSDEDTLETVTLAALDRKGFTAILSLNGFGEDLFRWMSNSATLKVNYQKVPLTSEEVLTRWQETKKLPATITALATLIPKPEVQELHLLLNAPEGEKHITRTYTGPLQMASAWAETLSLDYLRRLIK